MTSAIPTVPTTPAESTSQPAITIVVVPRERFSYSQQSLDSIYQYTNMPFELVYVDGGSPRSVQHYLRGAATERDFTLVRTDHFLAPNQARNLGLGQVETDYVLFIDNDVHVSYGWLEKLWECAQATDAAVVCPLTCIGKPLHQKVHLAGGEARIFTELKRNKACRRVHEKHYFVNCAVAEIQDQLQRRACEFAEFHCMLVKRSVFNQLGPLDEKLLSTREHIDFCLDVGQSGGRIYCEPDSVVTYVPDILYRWSDLAFFMLRWSDEWEIKSLKHFRQKWNLDQGKYFKKRYQRLGHRRHHAFLRPLVRKLTFGRMIPWLEKFVIGLERRLNRLITGRYMRLYGEGFEIRGEQVMSKVPSSV
ncbi:glycosyltransferase family 2 protein [Leptothoe spongobia]|uniref:Glycosyltransferase n=1 Tax=Leptothoe spongobia TAU-MAC 1115 TaxID=1967444 RepID=A0A947DEY7_9CYAN|nr:glycosyltransferase [Leptothoe spongobia]MBT9315525.1 glycosyltransferase [Leptothoe spongobia TAU-MAC 1115]